MRFKPATQVADTLLENFLSSPYWPTNCRLYGKSVLRDKIVRAIRQARIEGELRVKR